MVNSRLPFISLHPSPRPLTTMATHSHPHPHPHPHSPGPSPGPGPMPINPALTALLDSIPTNTLPFALVSVPLPIPPNATLPPGATPPTQTLVVCPTHKNVICEQCGVDYGGLNYMQQFLKDAPTEAVPPPPNMQPPQGRADAIKNAKDAGNVSVLGLWYGRRAESGSSGSVRRCVKSGRSCRCARRVDSTDPVT